jgi:hypothetical protein
MHQLARSLPLDRLREHPHEGGQRGRMIRPQKPRSSAVADDVAIQHKTVPETRAVATRAPAHQRRPDAEGDVSNRSPTVTERIGHAELKPS